MRYMRGKGGRGGGQRCERWSLCAVDSVPAYVLGARVLTDTFSSEKDVTLYFAC